MSVVHTLQYQRMNSKADDECPLFFRATDMLCVLTVVYEVLATVLLAYGCHRNIQAVGSTKEQKGGLMVLMLREGILYSV